MMTRNSFTMFIAALIFSFATIQSAAQDYRPIVNWSADVNQRIASFLEGTRTIKDRKVAVFDYDGTLSGQVPYYLVDEAIISYAFDELKGRGDDFAVQKVALMSEMVQGSTSSNAYVENRVRFLSGLPVHFVEQLGYQCFLEKYRDKIYWQMRQLIGNLESYGFEVWVITTSPEVLYQEIVHREFGIPKERVIGTKSIIVNGVLTEELVYPLTADGGKADAIHTFIKARPLFVAGNSRGDLEMMNESVGLKMIVNPDHKRVYNAGESVVLAGQSLYSYWKSKDALVVYCEDMEDQHVDFTATKHGIVKNSSVEKK